MDDSDTHRFSREEKDCLRTLALRVAELAARPVEQEKRREWHRHNALQPGRPLVFCDPENGWHEIFPAESLECTSELAGSGSGNCASRSSTAVMRTLCIRR